MFNVIKSLVAPEFPERKGSMGDDEPAGSEAGLEAGQAQEVYYLWFLDSHSSGGRGGGGERGRASLGADGDGGGRGN